MLPAPGAVTRADFHADGLLGVLEFESEPQNRLSRSLFEKLAVALTEAERSGVRALLIRSVGADFCKGGDFREWPTLRSHLERRERFAMSNAVLSRIERLPFPTVVAVQGAAHGGGFEVALRADLVVAAVSATFRFPEATVGVHPLAGGAQRVAERAGRAVATRLVMTSEVIGASEAQQLGLIAYVEPDDTLYDRAEELARRLATGPTRAHASTKLLLDAWSIGGVAGADTQMVELDSTILATQDVARGVAVATAALEGGADRPTLEFKGE